MVGHPCRSWGRCPAGSGGLARKAFCPLGACLVCFWLGTWKFVAEELLAARPDQVERSYMLEEASLRIRNGFEARLPEHSVKSGSMFLQQSLNRPGDFACVEAVTLLGFCSHRRGRRIGKLYPKSYVLACQSRPFILLLGKKPLHDCLAAFR